MVENIGTDNKIIISGEMAEEINQLYAIIKEKNEQIPYSFALAFQMLGIAIREMAATDGAVYDSIRGDIIELLNVIIGYNDRPHTIH